MEGTLTIDEWMDREDGAYIRDEVSEVDNVTEVTMEEREVK